MAAPKNSLTQGALVVAGDPQCAVGLQGGILVVGAADPLVT
jgi:hypothetical protein